MLATAYYNERLTDLRIQSDLTGAIASLVDAIDACDSLVVCYSAQEALGDYFERGKGSLAKGAATVSAGMAAMGVWFLNILKKITVFAVKGFSGTIGAAVASMERIQGKIADMGNEKITKGLTTSQFFRISEIMKEHAEDVEITVPNGKLAAAKIAYINQFNGKMKEDAKINAAFALARPPQPFKKATISAAGYKSFDSFKNVGDNLGSAEEALKNRLDKIKEVGGKINTIVRKLKAKGYSDKLMQKADTVQVLSAAYHAAILANDLKYLRSAEIIFKTMAQNISKLAATYAQDKDAANGAGEEITEETTEEGKPEEKTTTEEEKKP